MNTVQPRYERSTTDRKLLGVCGGLGARWGVDPSLLRVLVVVLALFGGIGLVAYLMAAALMPEPGQTDDLFSASRLPLFLLAILVAIVVLPSPWAPWVGPGRGFAWWGLLVPLLVIGLIVALVRQRDAGAVRPPAGYRGVPGGAGYPNGAAYPDRAGYPDAAGAGYPDAAGATYAAGAGYADPATGPASPGPAASTAPYPGVAPVPQPGEEPESPLLQLPTERYDPETAGYDPYLPPADVPPVFPTVGYAATPYAPPAAPPKPRVRSYLGAMTLGLSVIWFGLAWALNAMDATDLSAVTIFGVSLLILGAGILLGTWIGRARWLVLFALPLALVVWGLAAVPDGARLGQAPDWVSQGIGQTTFAPSTANPDTFAYGLGQATIDLADWAQYPQVERVTASVGAGELVISVPQGWDVTVLAKVGLGAITRDGATVVDGQDITQRLVFDSPTPSARTLTVDASVNVGQITTVTVAEGALS